MNNIKIYDQFLTTDELQLCHQITSEHRWEYGHTSGQVGIYTPFWYMELIHNDFLKESIKHKIENVTNKKFKVNRLYANGQTYGQNGSFHQDDTSEKSYTFCLYVIHLPCKYCNVVFLYLFVSSYLSGTYIRPPGQHELFNFGISVYIVPPSKQSVYSGTYDPGNS